MKKLFILALLLCVFYTSSAQIRFALKAGGGTSWATYPKVFVLPDTSDPNNIWELSPATNSGTFYIGGEAVIPMGEHWFFRGGLSYSYISGEVKVDKLNTSQQSRKLQAYSRLNIPLLFGIKSKDEFFFSFGPVVFINLHDNHGFDEAVGELTPQPVDSSVPVGLQMRLATDIQVQKNLFLEIKFDYDLGKYFRYNETAQIYETRIAMQGITGGLTYFFE